MTTKDFRGRTPSLDEQEGAQEQDDTYDSLDLIIEELFNGGAPTNPDLEGPEAEFDYSGDIASWWAAIGCWSAGCEF